MSNIVSSFLSTLTNNAGKVGHTTEFSLEKFAAEVNRRGGPYQPTLWLCEIALPNWVQDRSVAQTLPFFCSNVNLPGATIVPVDVRRQGIGPMDRRPSNVSMPDITANFMMDNEGVILTFFQSWLNNVVNFNTRGGEHASIDGAYPFEVHYRDRYLCPQMTIKTFDHSARVIHTQTFYEAWPFQIGDLPLNYATNDTHAELTMGFYYRTWTSRSEKFDADAGSTLHTDSGTYGTEGGESMDGGRQLSTSERLLQIATSGLAVYSSIKKPNHVGDYINAARNLKVFKKVLTGQ